MSWSWRCETGDGAEIEPEGVATEVFGTRSDAESWLGENWRELRAAGVEQVTLLDDRRVSYGPMSLQDPE